MISVKEGGGGDMPPEERQGEEEEKEEEEGVEEEEEEEEEELEGTAEECLLKGKELCKSASTIEQACKYLSAAISKQLAPLDNTELHPLMSEYYLVYGDALLKKEEELSGLFGGTAQDEPDESDMELAWEVLELARTCYELMAKDKLTHAIIMDWSYSHVRLGDILCAQSNFDQACIEYSRALELRVGMDAVNRLAVLISLAQAYLFSNNESRARQLFNEALVCAQECLSGNPEWPEDKRKVYETTLEDVKVQIEEIDFGIKEGLYDVARKVAAAVENKSGFSKPQLDSAEVVDLGVVSRVTEKRPHAPPADTESKNPKMKDDNENVESEQNSA